MSRCVVTVATNGHQEKLKRWKRSMNEALQPTDRMLFWEGEYPPGSPAHEEIPWGFKIWALEYAWQHAYGPTLLWTDSSIMPYQEVTGWLDPLWEEIELHGYWMSSNVHPNCSYVGQSCWEQALPILGVTKEEADKIPCVIAGAIGLDMARPIARQFLAEWKRLALAGAFNAPPGFYHRHDQSAASVVAWRLGMKLTTPPEFLSDLDGVSPKPVRYTVLVVKR